MKLLQMDEAIKQLITSLLESGDNKTNNALNTQIVHYKFKKFVAKQCEKVSEATGQNLQDSAFAVFTAVAAAVGSYAAEMLNPVDASVLIGQFTITMSRAALNRDDEDGDDSENPDQCNCAGCQIAGCPDRTADQAAPAA